jgi:outer membrane receptor protein involved in Fe transport
MIHSLIRWRSLAIALALLLIVPAAFAQTTGRIEGRSVDEDGTALPGVTITLESPSLQGQKVAVTDTEGRFRFLGLPVGVYSFIANLDGYGMIEQAGIEVRLDRGVQITVELPSAIEETITVSSDMASVIDRSTTTSGVTFNSDLVKGMPLPRSAMSLAFAAPGVVEGGLNLVNGGQNPSIGGASAAENRYVVDGLDTTDPAFGTVGTTIPTDFIKEVEVKTGGYEAEYGGALGGMLNVVTKSGGNDLTIDAFANYTDPDLQQESPPTPQTGRFLGEEEQDYGLALGGKITEDKLWYFVAVNLSETADQVTTRADLIETKDNDRETTFYTGKLTWQPNPRHQFAFSTFGDPTDNKDVVRNAYGLLGTNDEFGATNYGVTYNATLSSSTFLELAAGRYEEDVISLPLPDSSPRTPADRSMRAAPIGTPTSTGAPSASARPSGRPTTIVAATKSAETSPGLPRPVMSSTSSRSAR